MDRAAHLEHGSRRRFVVVGHGVDASGGFSLDDLCGGAAGRLDVLLRCVSSAVFVSHGIRRDVEILLVFPRGPKTVRLSAAELRCANPDERSTGALVRKALREPLDGSEERRSSSGVYVSGRGFEETVAALPNPIHLVEDGAPWSPSIRGDVTFVLSDHRDLLAEEEAVLERIGALRISLGPESLHGNHCITIAHHLMDGRS
jgi:tRNA (pseudouridine54-N1)-methyltransferase